MSDRGCVDGEKEVLKSGADIYLIGRAVNASKDTGHAAEEFIGKRNRDERASGAGL